MEAELEQILDELCESWNKTIQGRVLQLQGEGVDASGCSQIIAQVSQCRELIDGRNLIFNLEYDTEAFDYRVIWQQDGHVVANPDTDTDIALDRLFESEEVQSAFRSIRNDRIRDGDELESILRTLVTHGSVEASFQYHIEGEHIDDFLENETSEPVDITYYFSGSSAEDKIKSLSIENLKEYIFTSSDKRVLAVRGLQSHAYGADIGFFPPKQLFSASFRDFCDRSSRIDAKMTDIRRECAIDYFEERYIPPDYLEIDTGSDFELLDIYYQHVRPFQLLLSVIGISNIARSHESAWKVRINGRRVVESEISLSSDNGTYLLQEGDSESRSVEITAELVNKTLDIFDWIYSTRTEDRITVFRNIVTIYTTSVVGMLDDIEEIAKSSRSNFRFYVRDSVEEFVGVQQDISSYVFETQREMSDLRRGLANNLNKDLFRVFGFTAITWVTIISGLSEVTNIRAALAISLAPVTVYLLLGLRSTYALSQQYQSIKDGREQYYAMYENRVDRSILKEIRDADGSDTMDKEFTFDLYLYYILFSTLFFVSLYSIGDLTIFHGPLTDVINHLTTSQL